MKVEKASCEKLLNILTKHMDKEVNVYVGDSNIKYEYKRLKDEGACYTYIDVLDTNGEVFEDDENSCVVQDSDFVIIKTLNKQEIENINMILSYEMYGRITSELLRTANEKAFMKFNSSTRGMFENYKNNEKSNCFNIVPVIEQTKHKVRTI